MRDSRCDCGARPAPGCDWCARCWQKHWLQPEAMEPAAPTSATRPSSWTRWRGGVTSFGPAARVTISLPLLVVCAALARSAQVNYQAGYVINAVVDAVWLVPTVGFTAWFLRQIWAIRRVG